MNLPDRLAGELVESVPEVVIVRGVRAEHHYRGVPVPQVGPEGGPLRGGDLAGPAVAHDVCELARPRPVHHRPGRVPR